MRTADTHPELSDSGFGVPTFLALATPVYGLPLVGALVAGYVGLVVGVVLLVALVGALVPRPPAQREVGSVGAAEEASTDSRPYSGGTQAVA